MQVCARLHWRMRKPAAKTRDGPFMSSIPAGSAGSARGVNKLMHLRVRYMRMYALAQKQAHMPSLHPSSPLSVANFPSDDLTTEVHIGRVPDDILQALKCHRAWLQHSLIGGFKSAEDLRKVAAQVTEHTVLRSAMNQRQVSADTHWFVTLCINDRVEAAEDASQELLGIETHAWLNLDSPPFFEKHAEILDRLSTNVAIAFAPHRYRWQIWDGPLVELPTGISLRPPRFRGGRLRAFNAPPLEKVDVSGVLSASSLSRQGLPPIVGHFYLRAMVETDRIARFFDAFRALEVLSTHLEPTLRAKATIVCKGVCPTAAKAAESFKRGKDNLKTRFATLALALDPVDADNQLDKFITIYDWRNDLVHGNRKLNADDSPDEEVFELLHKYLALTV